MEFKPRHKFQVIYGKECAKAGAGQFIANYSLAFVQCPHIHQAIYICGNTFQCKKRLILNHSIFSISCKYTMNEMRDVPLFLAPRKKKYDTVKWKYLTIYLDLLHRRHHTCNLSRATQNLKLFPPYRLDKPARLTIRVLWFLFLIICQIRS